MRSSKKNFNRSIDELKYIFGFIDGFTRQYKVPKAIVHDVTLAVEEIFTNMVKYNPQGPDQVKMSMQIVNNSLRIEMTDIEEHPFDITMTNVYDLNQSVEERPIGRLGIHFVKKVMDHLEYQHQNKQTVITMIKNLGETNV